MLSATKDQRIAQSFAALRDSSGEQHRGKSPAGAVAVKCDLRYPHEDETADGPLFVAQEMEDKWDIYLYGGYLYLARSWTGTLVFRAKMALDGPDVVVSSIEVASRAAGADPSFAVRQVDFLIKSHLYGFTVPHPLPQDCRDDPEAIVAYSFSQYGRRALFATYADTTQLVA